jgi:Uma2 family endonuclease
MSALATQPHLSPPLPASPSSSVVVPDEHRITIRGLSWDLYDRLSDEIGEGQPVHLTYDGRDLEIMTTGYLHEEFKELLGRLINAVTVELDIPCGGGGQTTWKRPEVARGLEADLCYHFEPGKLAAVGEAVPRKSRDIADYPNPDLAIESDLSPSQVDRPGIYLALHIVEAWRFDGESLAIEQLGPEGTYVVAESSRFLPIRATEIVRWVTAEETTDKTAWERRLRAWIRAELAPRRA